MHHLKQHPNFERATILYAVQQFLQHSRLYFDLSASKSSQRLIDASFKVLQHIQPAGPVKNASACP